MLPSTEEHHTMTRKDYRLISEVLSTAQDKMVSQEEFWELCAKMADRLAENDGSFSIERFLIACGAEPG
jgi:hypothetical protein